VIMFKRLPEELTFVFLFKDGHVVRVVGRAGHGIISVFLIYSFSPQTPSSQTSAHFLSSILSSSLWSQLACSMLACRSLGEGDIPK